MVVLMKLYTDKELVNSILNNKEEVIKYFFFEQCDSMYSYIVYSIFAGKVQREELINELFLFLQKDDWYKLRQFDYKSKLTTWLNVVSIRYFLRNRELLIENSSTSDSKEPEEGYNPEETLIAGMDSEKLLAMMANERYREVIRLLVIDERPPQDVSVEWGVTIDNLYNIKRRALKQLEQIITTLR